MLATVEIDVIGPDMFTASRHAQSIAENFLNDVDDFQRASRDADRRAMSHFDAAATPEVGLVHGFHRRRSLSGMRYSVPATSDYVRGRYWSRSVEPVRYPAYSPYTPAVTVVGSRYPSSYPYGYLPAKTIYDRTYPYTYNYPGKYSSYPYYNNYEPASRYYYSDYYPKSYVTPLPSYYNYYTSRYYYPYNDVLPTSHLRASTGPKPNWEFLSRPALTRRWWSSSDLLSDVNPVSVVPIVPLPHRAHRGMYRRTARYGSVPPIGSSLPTYQRAVSVAPVPRHFYAHYYSDLTEKTPSYHSFYNHTNLNGRTHGSPQTSYIGASGDEQLHLREFKTSPHSYAALRTAYRNFYRPTALGTYPASLGSVSNEIMAERRKIDIKPSIRKRVEVVAPYSVAFEEPYSRGPALYTSPLESDLYYRSPRTTMGYGPIIAAPTGSLTSELRGRIKRLLCRSHKDPHHFRYYPQATVIVGAA